MKAGRTPRKLWYNGNCWGNGKYGQAWWGTWVVEFDIHLFSFTRDVSNTVQCGITDGKVWFLDPNSIGKTITLDKE
jgi:hypothetical protein